jgi:hypothetical protein
LSTETIWRTFFNYVTGYIHPVRDRCFQIGTLEDAAGNRSFMVSEFSFQVTADEGVINPDVLYPKDVFLGGDMEDGNVQISGEVSETNALNIGRESVPDNTIGIGGTTINKIRLGLLEFINTEDTLYIKLRDNPEKVIELRWPRVLKTE